MDDPARAIMRLAANLVAQSELKRPYQNLLRLASIQDIIQIKPVSMQDAGRLVPGKEGLIIQTNAAHSHGKQNFTVCHEIGHTLIPSYWQGPPERVDSGTGMHLPDREEEFLCDLAASELLMPTLEFQNELAFQRLHIWSVEQLAQNFGASREAAAIKCVHCGAGRVALIVWEAINLEPSRFNYRDESGANRFRIKFACCGGLFGGQVFPRGRVCVGATSVQQAYLRDGWHEGEETLPTLQGSERFYTESQAFTYRVGREWERKVLTFVFLSD